jgi:predicted phage baseplate assembly protein
LRLFLSPPPAQLPLFGRDGWWLRLRPHEPATDWAPVVRGLYLNAVTAEQAKSLRHEILGSSLGQPDQLYTLAETPVLPETLELRVRESLSDEEKQALTGDDPDAVASYPLIDGDWIRWRATDTFVGQGGGARLFRLDPASGEIRFGNGRDGKIPPAGRDAVRAVAYQAGGGSRGNVAAAAAKQLKTALESVDLAFNPVDAGGGADAPARERLAQTAPARLRHANRALTPGDVEALATGSSPDVVRARCLRGRGCGIDLVVAIRTGERCPALTRARGEGIARNIAAKGWGALPVEAIRVRGPRYVFVKIELVVTARSAEGVAQVENDLRKLLLDFLHPVEGGADGLGWPFGRRPWPSDVQRLVAAVVGVDRVDRLLLAARDPCADLDALGEDALVCADEEDVLLTVQPPRGGE